MPPDGERGTAPIQADLLHELLQTPEMRSLVNTLIPELLGLWTGDQLLKNRFTHGLGRRIHARRNGHGKQAPRLGHLLPELLDALLATVEEGLTASSKLSVEVQEKWLKEQLAQWGKGGSGRLLTRVATALHDLHAHHPTALADAVAPVLARWIEATDFGALRELADDMGPEVVAFAEAVNDLLWRYPGKLVLTLSFLPDLLNAAVAVFKTSAGRFNRAAPDLVADIALSLMRAVDGATMGETLDELTRLVRAVHTGSSLIGDPGRSQFFQDAGRLVTTILDRMDAELYWQARVAVADGRATLKRALLDACSDRPAFVTQAIGSFAARHNPGVGAGVHRLQLLDDLEDAELSESLDQGLAALDMQAVGEIVNLTCVLVNRVAVLNPKLIHRLAEQLAAAVDVNELAAAATAALELSVEPLQPVWRAVLPPLVSQACRVLEPADDAYEAEAAEARQALRDLLLGGGRSRC